MPTTPRDFQQGPGPQPRNRLADWAREYGLYGLSNRLNDPTSGIGLVTDAIGGLGNALFVQPAQSFNRLLTEGYQSGNPQSAEDAFNVAGAAMVGGLAAPRGKAVTPKEQPLVGYRGSSYGGAPAPNNPTYWASSSPDLAADYAAHTAGRSGPSVTPSEFRFSNPLMIDAQGASWQRVPYEGGTMTTDNVARRARLAGNDGVVFQNVVDEANGNVTPQTTIAALQPGTVYSPLTGELLYANGGRPGAAVGAAANAAAEKQGIRAYHGSPHDSELMKILDKYGLSGIIGGQSGTF